MNKIEELELDLIQMGFADSEIEYLIEDNLEDICVKVYFNWRWNDSDKIHHDGRQEFNTSFDNVKTDLLYFIRDKNKNFEVLI